MNVWAYRVAQVGFLVWTLLYIYAYEFLAFFSVVIFVSCFIGWLTYIIATGAAQATENANSYWRREE